MSVFVFQNGVNVSKVKPGTAVELYANDLGYALWVESMVTQTPSGAEFFRQSKLTTFMGNVTYEWTVPNEVGEYIFFPDTSRPDTFKHFEVSDDAPDPWEQKENTTNWLLIAGIGSAALVLAAGLFSLRR
jgi:LPXTG-motif cell wall-anchored protein